MSPHPTHVEIGEQWELYRAQLGAHGHSIEGREIPMARLIAIAPTDAEAAAVAREGAKWLLRTYVNPKGAVSNEDLLARYVDRVVIHGSPERVADEIARLREAIHLEYLIAAPLSHQTFLSFTDHVLPRLQS
jgi:alkanesulfonate monooxygenase SsuD/methylene tetrahydromethanopterin reductase-like flavin-dependent oxidoreductase (luciferase family)